MTVVQFKAAYAAFLIGQLHFEISRGFKGAEPLF
jgi:hypothetical protein